ncbi:MAG: DNA-formamidopyrimidine glycosylase family protein [Acidimicrobiales bacterium]
MPEMPEVQAHAERMSDALTGATLGGFRLLNFASIKTFSPPAEAAVGRTLTGVGRRGKLLKLRFDDPAEGEPLTHVVHLMQGGRLRPDPKQAKKPRGGIARWTFEVDRGDGTTATEAWLLTEAGTERKAGVWSVAGDPDAQPPLDDLGPEADGITLDTLAQRLDQGRRLHGLLRTQGVIAGLGRMLTNEILHEAGLSPFATANKLDDTEIARLHEAMRSTIERALEHERTLDDIGKSADRPSRTHNRAGEACPGRDGVTPCGDEIRTVTYRSYTVYYCPTCQTGGKVLADNTTSKFLK